MTRDDITELKKWLQNERYKDRGTRSSDFNYGFTWMLNILEEHLLSIERKLLFGKEK